MLHLSHLVVVIQILIANTRGENDLQTLCDSYKHPYAITKYMFDSCMVLMKGPDYGFAYPTDYQCNQKKDMAKFAFENGILAKNLPKLLQNQSDDCDVVRTFLDQIGHSEYQPWLVPLPCCYCNTDSGLACVDCKAKRAVVCQFFAPKGIPGRLRLNSTDAQDSSFELTWDSVADAISYNIFWNVDETWIKIGEADENYFSYTIQELAEHGDSTAEQIKDFESLKIRVTANFIDQHAPSKTLSFSPKLGCGKEINITYSDDIGPNEPAPFGTCVQRTDDEAQCKENGEWVSGDCTEP